MKPSNLVPTCPVSTLAHLLDWPPASSIPREKTNCEMDPADPDWNGLEAGAADNNQGAFQLIPHNHSFK